MNSSAEQWIAQHKILREVGRGGMGVVYEAEFQGQRRALKLLLKHDAALHQRFLREAQAVAAVDDHPNIVKVYSTGIDQGRPYISFDFVEGQSLEDELKNRGPLSLSEALEVVTPVLEALSHAHERGVVHRDLKPANILKRRSDGQYLLADFGLAQIAQKEALTITGELLGTPKYMAPEQVDSRRGEYGPWTDVWAVGVIFYELLTGRQLFQAETLMQSFNKIVKFQPESLRTMSELSDRGLDIEVLERCLKPETSERYPSARALLSTLAGLQSQGLPAKQPRALWLFLVLALVLGSGLVFGAWAVLEWRQQIQLQAEHNNRLWPALKRARPDCVTHLLKRQAGQSPVPTEAMTDLVSLWSVIRNERSPDSWASWTEFQKRRKLLALALRISAATYEQAQDDILCEDFQALNQLWPWTSKRIPSDTLEAWLSDRAVKQFFRERSLGALRSLTTAQLLQRQKREREALEALSKARLSLGKPRAFAALYDSLWRSQTARELTEASNGVLAAAALGRYLDSQRTAKDIALAALSECLQEWCDQSLASKTALLRMRLHVEELSMTWPGLRRPRLSEACWAGLKPSPERVYERHIWSLRRWQDGLRDFSKEHGPREFMDWVSQQQVELLANTDKQRQREVLLKCVTIIVEAMKIGCFFDFGTKTLSMLFNTGAIRSYIDRHPRSPFGHCLWVAGKQFTPLDGETVRAMLRRLEQAEAHPRARPQLMKAILFHKRRVLELLREYSNGSREAATAQFLKVCKRIREDESPFTVEVNHFCGDHLFHINSGFRQLAPRLVKQSRRLIKAHRKAHASGDYYIPEKDHFFLIRTDEMMQRQELLLLNMEGRWLNLTQRYQQTVDKLEAAAWANPEVYVTARTLFNAYVGLGTDEALKKAESFVDRLRSSGIQSHRLKSLQGRLKEWRGRKR